MISESFSWLDAILAVLIPCVSLLTLMLSSWLTHRHYKKGNDLTTESVAYRRVEFLSSEINTLRADLNLANEEIQKLKAMSRQRDLDLLEQERLKNIALGEVTRLKNENQGLLIQLEKLHANE